MNNDDNTEFAHNRRSGKGVYVTAKGVEYHGEFVNDREKGQFLVKTPVGPKLYEVSIVHFTDSGDAHAEQLEHSIHPMVTKKSLHAPGHAAPLSHNSLTCTPTGK